MRLRAVPRMPNCRRSSWLPTGLIDAVRIVLTIRRYPAASTRWRGWQGVVHSQQASATVGARWVRPIRHAGRLAGLRRVRVEPCGGEGRAAGLVGEALLKSGEAPADHGAVSVVGQCVQGGDPGGELLLG